MIYNTSLIDKDNQIHMDPSTPQNILYIKNALDCGIACTQFVKLIFIYIWRKQALLLKYEFLDFLF